MVDGCEGNGVLLRVSLSSVKSWYRMGILRLIRNMEGDPVLAFVAVGRVTEIDWDAFEDQDWFSYDDAEGKVVVLPTKPPMRRLSADGVEVHEGGQPELKPKYHKGFAEHGMSKEFGAKGVTSLLCGGD